MKPNRSHNICERYPDYRFSICGMGELPEDADSKLGKCSQMVTFVRTDMIKLLNDASAEPTSQTDRSNSEVVFPLEKFKYNLLFSKEFPYDQDARTPQEKIIDDVKYFIHRHSCENSLYFDYEKDIFEFPVPNIFPFIHEVINIDELRTIIRTEFVINENDCIVYKLPEDSDFDDDYEDDDVEAEPLNDPTNESSEANNTNQNANALKLQQDEEWD